MPKKVIGNCYFISLVVYVLSAALFYAMLWSDGGGNIAWSISKALTGEREIADPGWIVFLLVMIFLAGLLGMIGWIGTLINLGKAHEWVWFFLTFFFGAIVVFVYLIAGPQPLKPGQVPQQQLAGLPPNVPLANPAQPSALEMLRQRYVRGEIDEATFDRMRTRLEG